MSNMLRGDIWLIEKNIRGAWVIYGKIGIRQYYYYKKHEARKLYLDECRKKIIKREVLQCKKI